ncbi:MAG: carboxypeptidase M32 [Emergencia sp.]
MTYDARLAEFKELVKKIEYIKYTLNGLIYWDKITYMPKDGIGYRSQVMSFLADEQYKLFAGDIFRSHVEYFDGNRRNDTVTDAMIRRIKRNSRYVSRIPEAEYRAYIELIAVSEQIWAEAGEKKDFLLFYPQLVKIIDCFQKFAEYWGYEEDPYDALLGYYEEEMTVSKIDPIVQELKTFLIEFIARIEKEGRVKNEWKQNYTVDKHRQEKLWETIISKIGFDFDRGRLDTGSHTTILANSPFDVRIVNTYSERELKTGIFNALHSCGKGIYQQSIDPKLLGTLLCDVSSFAMEESIGRFYENMIGRNRGFWSCFIEEAKKIIPELEDSSPQLLFEKGNLMHPSATRIDADELTYLVHVIIRYELERDLINGKIRVKDLPELWKEKYRTYLGVTPQNDGEGVLQDIHWAAGYIGYFPSYFLSNLWAAQFAAAIEREVGSLETLTGRGEFDQINRWLTEKVYQYGAIYSSEELIRSATGEPLSSKYYIDYLRKKYSEVYKLN